MEQEALYREVRTARLAAALVAVPGLLALGVAGLGSGPAWPWLVAGGVALLLAAAVESLRVTVVPGELRLRLGLLGPWRRVPLERVRELRAVRIPWYHGYGVRLIPSGWCWRLRGGDGVELELERGRRLQIGARCPAELARALRRAGAAAGRQAAPAGDPRR